MRQALDIPRSEFIRRYLKPYWGKRITLETLNPMPKRFSGTTVEASGIVCDLHKRPVGYGYGMFDEELGGVQNAKLVLRRVKINGEWLFGLPPRDNRRYGRKGLRWPVKLCEIVWLRSGGETLAAGMERFYSASFLFSASVDSGATDDINANEEQKTTVGDPVSHEVTHEIPHETKSQPDYLFYTGRVLLKTIRSTPGHHMRGAVSKLFKKGASYREVCRILGQTRLERNW